MKVIIVLSVLFNLLKGATLYDIIGNYSTSFKDAIDANPGLNHLDMCSNSGKNCTVFAPSNNGFMYNGFTSGAQMDYDLLLNHIIYGSYMDTDLVIGMPMTTLATNSSGDIGKYMITFVGDNKIQDYNGQNVTINMTNIIADDGVLHIIDGVLFNGLIPDGLEDAGSFTTLLSLLPSAPTVLAEASDINNVITVLAPVDIAFLGVPTDVLSTLLTDSNALTATLLYHVLPGPRPIASYTVNETLTTLSLTGGTVGIETITPLVTYKDSLIRPAELPCFSYISGQELFRGNGIIQPITCVLAEYSMLDVIQMDSNLTTLYNTAINTPFSIPQYGITNVGQLLQFAGGGYTLFAPINPYLDGVIQKFMPDPAETFVVLAYHLIAGAYLADSIKSQFDGDNIETLSGFTIKPEEMYGGQLTITDSINNVSTVIVPNIVAGNGIVHVILGILLPGTVWESVATNPDLQLISTFLYLFNLTSELEGTIMLAPTDEAIGQGLLFATLASVPYRIGIEALYYHLIDVSSTNLTMSGEVTNYAYKNITVDINMTTYQPIFTDGTGGIANVVDGEIKCIDGSIYVIDRILLPFTIPLMNIGDYVTTNADNDLTQLKSVLMQAMLIDTLNSRNNQTNPLTGEPVNLGFTLLAPNDWAFSKIPADQLAAFAMKNGGQDLAGLLTTHVLPMTYLMNDLKKLAMTNEMVTTLSGVKLTVGMTQDWQYITFTDPWGNMAKILNMDDIYAQNGVIFKLDMVLGFQFTTADYLMYLAASQNITTVAAKIQAKGLSMAFANPAQMTTLFAPTDYAFSMVDSNVLANIIGDNTTALMFLKYHALGMGVMPMYLMNGKMFMTLQGNNITIEVNMMTNKTFIVDQNGNNNAMIMNLKPMPIKTTNGYIYIINNVLQYESGLFDTTTPAPAPAPTGNTNIIKPSFIILFLFLIYILFQ